MKRKVKAYGPDCAHCNLVFNEQIENTGYCPENPAYHCIAAKISGPDKSRSSENTQLSFTGFLAIMKAGGSVNDL